MKKIVLARGEEALVDDEDYELLSVMKWYLIDGYAATTLAVGEKRKTVRMHRFVMNAPDDKMVDHKDHCRLNNQKSNLRFATNSQNRRNSPPQDGSSKYKGVTWYPNLQKWAAQIQDGTIRKRIGYFSSEAEAALAYNDAAKKIYGEFAYLNTISDLT